MKVMKNFYKKEDERITKYEKREFDYVSKSFISLT